MKNAPDGSFRCRGLRTTAHIEAVTIVQIVLTNGIDKENDNENAVNLFVAMKALKSRS